MAINKQAKNIHVIIKKADIIFAGNFTVTAKKVIIEATNDELVFNGTKKINIDGN
ncbi:hypothetical protein HNQ02_003730 [Flavobacterium sp. 7E]|uniref:hypothetical protein n=1 Tax=Flavobacterium sp. 7E TaxID=2735898 RepID=UPI00156E07CC|nr:hypothetical protein [Flavobacterium sp. 7E]NRS89927.1 hypothetical protein [Flavobacterium sp. 7E]NRS90783.1 hypothetical protein [Flavobacterium sp. 7E]